MSERVTDCWTLGLSHKFLMFIMQSQPNLAFVGHSVAVRVSSARTMSGVKELEHI